jgi:glycosyltransferase involved in cell wall biosynthesis
MPKSKLLCILHRSPPAHGAAKVGDFIVSSQKLQENFDCRFISIKSSETIGDIDKVNLKKFYLVAELYVKVLWALLTFRPDKIYFTASIRSVALYRDLLVSTLWKSYRLFKKVDIYYHYHTKGVDDFVSSSERNLKLTRFFVKDVNLVLLSPLLEKDFDKLKSYNSISFLPNGIEDPFEGEAFDAFVQEKFESVKRVEVLYMAHMMKEKGYDEVLELARQSKEENVHYHFAGSWQNSEDEKYFRDFVKAHDLDKHVTYHGFVSGEQKKILFKQAHMLAYPSKNDAFPLTLLESLSYGVPVIATNEGSIPYILDDKSGMILETVDSLVETFESAKEKLINQETAMYCRERYLEHFSLAQFEENLVNIVMEKRSV